MKEVPAVYRPDFRAIPLSTDSPDSFWKSWLQEAQSLQHNAKMSLSEALDMPFNFIFEYYKTEAWNDSKVRTENHETIIKGLFARIDNVLKLLSGR